MNKIDNENLSFIILKLTGTVETAHTDTTCFSCRYCEDGLCESVATLIWAAPRLQSEVKELRVVRLMNIT